ncbi:MAG: YfhO family protein [Acidimicrobiia bacterium]|nr:YfhO family protein [Acidimicrobiia bacterium]
MPDPPARTRWLTRSLWPALAVVAACVPFVGAISSTRVFHLRDLSMFFWPQYLWLRDTLLSGAWPSWDPYVGGGQPTDPNALNQMFLPPVLLLRLLLPPVVGFNAIVATPFPLAALGMWLFLRRCVSAPSATVGAIVFAAGGPMVSTGNFPNLSWSIACVPWLLWSLDRDRDHRSPRTLALVALVAALQMLPGKPVTMLGSLALATLYVTLGGEARTSWSERLRILWRFAVGTALAGVVSIVQLAPTALASRGSVRGLMLGDAYWSLHPLWLTEAVLPRVYGHAFDGSQLEMPWLWPLNSGRDPFFYSLYVGGLVIVLAIAGAFTAPRHRARFWVLVAVGGVLCALGDFAPVYPWLQDTFPLLRTFRFPIKFFLFTALASAVLAAHGVDAWCDAAQQPRTRRVITRATLGAGLAVAGLVGLFLWAPLVAARGAFTLGQLAHLADPVEGAAFFFRSVPAVGGRAVSLFAVGTLLAFASTSVSRGGTLVVGAFGVLAVGDLLVANAGHNPVMPASRLGPPAWTQVIKAQPGDRFYFGAKFDGRLAIGDPDMPTTGWRSPEGASFGEARSLFMAQLAVTPAGWGARELLSYDLPKLWPVAHAEAEERFRHGDRATRLRFMKRGGVRYCVLGDTPYEGAVPLARVGDAFSSMAVYECVPDARRAYIVSQAIVEPSMYNAVRRLFEADFPAESTAMLERPAGPASGPVGPPAAAAARIVIDQDQRVDVEASVPDGGGYLVLLDTFDSSWRADVDGVPTPLFQANGLYRAVRLSPGTHYVRFQHEHTILKTWLPISVAGGLLVGAILARGPRRRGTEPAAAAEDSQAA